MTQLSLAMIVKDEEANLAHCLASVRDLVDEMVVVDTGSRDGTPAIAASFGARLERFGWCDDFSAARNAALARCSGDWILVLDADEAIDRLDHPILRRLLETDPPAAFTLPVRNYVQHASVTALDAAPVPNRSPYSEGAGIPYYLEVRLLRLCRNLPGLAFRGRIHESLDPFFQEGGLEVRPCAAVIHHYGKLQEDLERGKQGTYLRIAETDAAREPGNPRFQFNLLMQARQLHRWEQALGAASAYLRLVRQAPAFVPLAAAEAQLKLGRPAQALPLLERILKAEPAHPLALAARAGALEALGRRADAVTCLRRAVAANPYHGRAFLDLAELLDRLGRFDEGRKALLEGAERNPGDESLLLALLRLDLARDRRDLAAADALLALQRCPGGGQGAWHWLAALGRLQAGDATGAKRVLAEGLQRFPEHPELLRLRRGLGAGG